MGSSSDSIVVDLLQKVLMWDMVEAFVKSRMIMSVWFFLSSEKTNSWYKVSIRVSQLLLAFACHQSY